MSKHRSIRNIDDLRSEIDRLKGQAKEQEQAIRQDYDRLKESLRPENLLLSALSGLTGIRINKGEFFRHGLAMGINLVLGRFLYKTEDTIERKLYKWIDKIFHGLRNFAESFSKTGSVRSEKIEQED